MLVYYIQMAGLYGTHDLDRMIVSIDIQEKIELFNKVRISFIEYHSGYNISAAYIIT